MRDFGSYQQIQSNYSSHIHRKNSFLLLKRKCHISGLKFYFEGCDFDDNTLCDWVESQVDFWSISSDPDSKFVTEPSNIASICHGLQISTSFSFIFGYICILSSQIELSFFFLLLKPSYCRGDNKCRIRSFQHSGRPRNTAEIIR